MDIDKEYFRIIIYLSVFLVVFAVGMFAWYKNK